MSKKSKYFWAGFMDGNLMCWEIDDGFGGYGEKERVSPAIFMTRKEARQQFKDVRKVEIREVKP